MREGSEGVFGDVCVWCVRVRVMAMMPTSAVAMSHHHHAVRLLHHPFTQQPQPHTCYLHASYIHYYLSLCRHLISATRADSQYMQSIHIPLPTQQIHLGESWLRPTLGPCARPRYSANYLWGQPRLLPTYYTVHRLSWAAHLPSLHTSIRPLPQPSSSSPRPAHTPLPTSPRQPARSNTP